MSELARSGHLETLGRRDGFLKGNAELIALALRFFDLTLVVTGAILAHYFRFGELELSGQYKIALITGLLACGSVFPLYSLYKPWRGASISSEVRTVLFAWMTVVIALPVIVYLTKTGDSFSRLWFVYWVALTGSTLIASRVAIRYASRWARIQGFNTRNILIVGAGVLGQRVQANLEKNDWVGINTIGFLDDDPEKVGQRINGLPVIGDASILARIAENPEVSLLDGYSTTLDGTVIDQIWIALPLSAEERIREVSSLLNDSAISIIFVPDIFVHGILNHSVDHFAGMSVVNLRSSPLEGISSTVKMIEDFVISLLAILITAIPMMLIALAIKLDSSGPVLFKQRRYGLDGKQITVWKFRTMNVLEDSTNVIQATKNDSRITGVGRFLRRTSLDELPQFFNVLQGRMSVVGPRPHAVAHNEKYRKIVDRYMWRCKVKPGITGWAQINGWRGETTDPIQMIKRVEFDLEYLQNWSLWFDLRIIVITALKEFTNKNTY